MVTHRKQELQQRFRRPVAFLIARISPEGVYGLHFTARIVVLAGATWLYGAISEDLITGDPLVAVDKVISDDGAPQSGAGEYAIEYNAREQA